MKFELPLPPSTNSLFVNARGPRGGRVKAPEYRQWITDAGWEIAKQRRGQDKITGPVALRCEIDDSSRIDLDNHTKPILDLLVAHSVIQDDNRRVVKKIVLEWASVKGVRVTVDAAES